ncbi:MAG TPA: diadenylate cyclase CdaA [Anaerolineaceae bacterium]|nr:diadenylate cyclase CdaA [Anaerolineaceae bacterium]
MPDLLSEISFFLQRLDWTSLLDLALVALVFFIILVVVHDTQAMVLLRGVIFLVVVFSLLTAIINLPAFSWLVSTVLPALLLAIPVIFAPEIRRGLERIGRAGSSSLPWNKNVPAADLMVLTIRAVVTAASRLSARQHGALIVLQRHDSLREYTQTGIRMDSTVTPEILMQIFYPNTPLHDGAVLITDNRIEAAACVMPLSSSGILNKTTDRKMGLRHRAALGISEASDAIAVVVSEETGTISIAHSGRIIRRLDSERLENILLTFYRPSDNRKFFARLFGIGQGKMRQED